MQAELFPQPSNLLPFDGNLSYFPQLFNKVTALELFDLLYQEIPWKQEPIFIFGKAIMQPRLTAWLGHDQKPYTYSGITMHAHPFTPTLLAIKAQVESVTDCVFSSALLNLYRDGKDGMGWHRDNEKELGPEPIIASVSLGAARDFQFRYYQNKQHLQKLLLENGSLLVMRGRTNHFWEHRVPKSSKPLQPRINITFRIID